MSTPYRFELDRTKALLLAGCCVGAAVLLFLAGSLTGILYSAGLPASRPQNVAAKPAHAQPPKPPQSSASSSPPASTNGSVKATAPPRTPPAAAVATASLSATPVTPPAAAPTSTTSATASAAAGASTAIPAAAVPTAAQSATTSAMDTKPSPATPVESAATAQTGKPAAPESRPVEVSYALPLAVRVGSFAMETNAQSLMRSLRDHGYSPTLSRWRDARGHEWYVVRLGPYMRWSAASKVAARVSIAEDVRPVIGPMSRIADNKTGAQ